MKRTARKTSTVESAPVQSLIMTARTSTPDNLLTIIELKQDRATVTFRAYKSIDMAYDYFNACLFDGKLPPVAITFTRKNMTKGYFHPAKFGNRDGERRHEIALNPDLFLSRDDRDTLSTLVHEMCHVYQHDYGTYPKNSYHDKAFSAIMEERGLITSVTGEVGGKRTGPKVTHYIQENGPFDRAVKEWEKHFDGITEWGSLPQGKEAKAKRESKTKYTCPECQQNAWAKPGARLLCGPCTQDKGFLIEMEAADHGERDDDDQ